MEGRVTLLLKGGWGWGQSISGGGGGGNRERKIARGQIPKKSFFLSFILLYKRRNCQRVIPEKALSQNMKNQKIVLLSLNRFLTIIKPIIRGETP